MHLPIVSGRAYSDLWPKESWAVRSWTIPEDPEAGEPNWCVHEEKFDKAGGTGLEHDLERFCTTLEWARDITRGKLTALGSGDLTSSSFTGANHIY